MAHHRELAGASAMGNVTLAREDARAVWTWRWLADAAQDARYATRSLVRQPAFAIAAIAIVALGAGATLAVFGLLDALVVRSLPVPRPDRLVWFSNPAFSYPIYREVKARMAVFDGVFGWNIDRSYVDWSGGRGELRATDVLEVTGDFFRTLRVGTSIGRTFGEDDGRVAVLTFDAWRSHFAEDPAAVGSEILVGDAAFTVVGVAPAGFFGVAPGLDPEVILPIAGRYGAADPVLTSTTSSWLHLMARLKDGVGVEQAQAALGSIWPAVLEATTPGTMPAGRRAIYLGRVTRLEPGRTGFSPVRNQFADPLWLLMGLVGLLLAVACASVANLLLARGVHRRREIAVRLAIGAGPGRVFRQLLAESVVLTLAGTTLGILLASLEQTILVGLIQTSRNHAVLDTSIGWRSGALAVLLALAISALSAGLPTLQAVRGSVEAVLRRRDGDRFSRLRRMSPGTLLVALQVALAVVLLAGAAVFARSLTRVLGQDMGIDTSHVLIVSADAAAAGYKGSAQRAFHLTLLERLRRVPGVESAALSWVPPISNAMGDWTQSIGVDDAPIATTGPSVYFNGISPHYFSTVGTRLRRGRDVAVSDTASTPRIVVVNEALARQFFSGLDPIGHRITIGRTAGRRNLEIVGVVEDAKYRTLQEPARNIAYLPIAQAEDVTNGRDLFAEIRTATMPAVAADASRIVRELDSRVPVRVETIAARIRDSTLSERLIAVLAAALGGAALVIACASLYGLLAYTVSRRRRDIGIRIAIGARPGSVIWAVQREALAVTLIGVAGGLAATAGLGRFLGAALLFQTAPTDPLALGVAAVLMLAVSAAAAFVPARRAAATDPLAALSGDS